MSPLRAALESALAENPDDLATHMAYADLLVEEGDPRGEFIQVQLALEDAGRGAAERVELKRREEELLERHQAEWIGEASPVFTDMSPLTVDGAAAWHFGLVRVFPWRDFRPLQFRRGWIDRLELLYFNARFADALGRAPTIRLLRDLTICFVDEACPGYDELARWSCLDHLQAFKIGYETYESKIGAEGISSVVSRMKRIESLAFYAHAVDVAPLFALSMPNLRSLTVNHLDEYPLELLAINPTLGKLESLACHPHALRNGDESAYISAAGFSALVRSPHMRSLKHLALYLTDIGDEGIAALVESGMLRRLRDLDLWNGRISDDGARLLAASPDLRHLARLRLSKNMLTEEGVRVLLDTGVNLEAEDQFLADAIDDHEHLFQGDCE